MSSKPPKYTGRKFVKPFSQKYGRRTGRDVLAGKTVRVDEEGLENFDDYLSESDLDVTRERALMRSIHEERESQLSDDSAKENAVSHANVSVSQSVPNRSALDSRMMKNGSNQSSVSMSQSQLSQGGKINNRSRFGWLRNKNIGRRTGKDIVAGKQIRRDEDGLEIFDDYLSPSSGTDSLLSHSSVNSQRRSQGRPGSANTNVYEDNDKETRSVEKSQSSPAIDPEVVHNDKLGNVRSNTQTEKQDHSVHHGDKSSEDKDDVENDELVNDHDQSENETEDENNVVNSHHENSDDENDDVINNEGLENEHENENNEVISDQENDESSEDELENTNNCKDDAVKEFEVETNEKQRGRNESEKQTSNQIKTAYVNDFENEYKSFVSDVQKSRISVAAENRKSANTSQKSSRHSEMKDHSYSESDSGDEIEIVTKSNSSLMRKSGTNLSIRSASDKSRLEGNPHTEDNGEDDKKARHANLKASDKRKCKQSEMSKMSLSGNGSITSKRSVQDKGESASAKRTRKSVTDRKQSKGAEKNDEKKLGSTAKTVHDDDLDDGEQSDNHDADNDDNESSDNEDDQYDDIRQQHKTDKPGKIPQDTNRSQTLQKDSQAHEYEQSSEDEHQSIEGLSEEEEEESEHDEDGTGPSSQTGIDVAGNRSGSITKLEAPDTSKVNFDKTRKRLSYSALEMSDESKKARLSRVKEANQSLQERSSKSMKSSIISRPSTSMMEDIGQLNKKTSNKNKKSVPDKVDQVDNKNKPADDKTGQADERTRIDSEYNEPSDFVSLASVARRRSTFVAHKYVSDDDSIDIIDDFSPKKKRKSVRSKKSVTNVTTQKSTKEIDTKEIDTNVSKTRKSKSTVKSKRTKSNAVKVTVDKDENISDGVTASVSESKNKSKGFIMTEQPQDDNSVEEIYRRNIENILNDVGDPHDSEIEIVEDFPKQKRGRKSANVNKADIRKSINDHENEVVNESDNNMTIDKNQQNKNTAKKQASKTKASSKSKAAETKTTKTRTKSKDLKQNTSKDQNKKSRKVSVSKSTKSSIKNNEVIDYDTDTQQEEIQSAVDNQRNDPYDLNEDDSENVDLYIEDDNVIDNGLGYDNAVHDSDIVTTKHRKNTQQQTAEYKVKTKETNIKSDKAKALKSKKQKYMKSKVGARRKLPSQSSVRSNRLKSGSSVSNKNKRLHNEIKRKNTDPLKEVENEENDSISKPKKSKISDAHQSAKRKLEPQFDKRRHKSLGVGASQDGKGNSSTTPRRKSHYDKVKAVSTPPVNSLFNVPTNFNSGISIRVSGRTELLDQIGSGYGNVPNMSIRENQPADILTPCLSKGGNSRKSKGHRVSICPVEKTVFSDGLNSSADIDVTKKSRPRLSSLGTPLPSMNSSPKHFFEQSRPGTPKPGRKSSEYIKSRLIVPEPACEGLRRSKRNRLPPVNWCHGERIVYARKNAYDWVILGVKESNEVRYLKMEEEKRKRRRIMNEIRKATQADKRDITKRKLSIHVAIPEDGQPVDTSEISVPEASSGESMMLNCIAKNDSRSPVGPHHGKPTKEDPYLIKKLIDQPLLSMGQLTIKPGAEKPPQIVDNAATTFSIHYGKLLVTIHNTTSLLETGDVFFVPFGCAYSIKNLRNDSAQLHYTLIKVVEPESPE